MEGYKIEKKNRCIDGMNEREWKEERDGGGKQRSGWRDKWRERRIDANEEKEKKDNEREREG